MKTECVYVNNYLKQTIKIFVDTETQEIVHWINTLTGEQRKANFSEQHSPT